MEMKFRQEQPGTSTKKKGARFVFVCTITSALLVSPLAFRLTWGWGHHWGPRMICFASRPLGCQLVIFRFVVVFHR